MQSLAVGPLHDTQVDSQIIQRFIGGTGFGFDPGVHALVH